MNRKLDPLGGVSLVVGSILGSGIFIAPGLIAAFSGSIWVAAGLWILGGLVCIAGALIYGGLGLQYPQGGGQYVYLRESMGPRYSRCYGWASMLIICPTMLAGTSLFFSELLTGVAPWTAPYAKPIAIIILALFTFLNTQGLRLAGWIQKSLVVLHVALFLLVVICAFIFLPGHELNSYVAAPAFGGLTLSKGLIALAAVLWSFEGFNTVTFVTNEIEGGEKNVRRIALYGCAIVMVLYLVFNAVVLSNVPLATITHETNAAAYLMSQIFGAHAASIVFALTALGVATVLHSSIIIGPRVIEATVADGSTLRSLAKRSSRTGSPAQALWFQFSIASFFVVIGHFEALITAFVVLNWLFYGLTAVGYVRVRRANLRAFDFACVGLFLSMVLVLLTTQTLDNPSIALVGFVAFVLGVYGPQSIPRPRWNAFRTAPVRQRPFYAESSVHYHHWQLPRSRSLDGRLMPDLREPQPNT